MKGAPALHIVRLHIITRNTVMVEVREFIRQPYAWPGGYPKVLIMSDSEYLCVGCAKDNYRLISDSTRHVNRDGWQASEVQINWEDVDAHCAHCNEAIKCAYGDSDND